MSVETYHTIKHRLGLQQDLPFTPDWSAAPDFLSIIVEYCLAHRPEFIVECSSGLTTLVLSRCCQMNAGGRVISLEDGESYALKTRALIDTFGLGQYASVIHAPLEQRQINSTDYLWYDTAALPDSTIDMLVIDGPSGFIQKNSRFPAVPVLFEQLADNGVIFLDDAARDDEKQIIELWQAEYSALTHEYIATERGCSVLKSGPGILPQGVQSLAL